MPVIVRVAVGVLRDRDGRVLVALRPSHKHQGDLWEFPGGKVEAGESSEAALQREIFEELGVVVHHSEPLITIPFIYPEKQVSLEVREITAFDGEPYGREGQAVRWVPLKELDSYAFPPANAPIINAIRLPDLVCVTGGYASAEDFRLRVAQAIARDIGMIVIRPDGRMQPDAEMIQVAAEMCGKARVSLVLSSAFACDLWACADGLHLRAEHLAELDRRPIGAARWLGASCHSLAEVERAKELGVDYLFLSPVLATKSHPGAKALGWDEFAAIIARAGIPAYALGGMQRSHLPEARLRGGRGIAGISSFWK